MPELMPPSAAVRDSFLAGERAACEEDGTPTGYLELAAADFPAWAAARGRPRLQWDVPVTELWYVEGSHYIGTVIIRHELTPALLHEGGHIGYHVVPACRRRGHATAMLAAACRLCRDRGMTSLLLTCDDDNFGSRKVIEANGGKLTSQSDHICRFWIQL
jgi:predicted acetyltransferase